MGVAAIRLLPERDCAACKNQAEWGCNARRWREPPHGEPDDESNWVEPAYLPVTFDGEETYACPRQSLKEEPVFWSRLFLLYSMFTKGHLPDKGAVVDQSNSLLEMFRIVDEANAAADDTLDTNKKIERAQA